MTPAAWDGPAHDDPALGPVCPLRASLAESCILAGGRWVSLAPGTADVSLSLLRRSAGEALCER